MTVLNRAATALKALSVSTMVVVAAAAVLPGTAFAQDRNAPCGRDQNNYPLQCAQPDPSANLEATCLTTDRVDVCVAYHQNSCQIRGFALACRLWNMGQNCYGGDQNVCNYYVSLLRANTACNLNRDPSACAWLRQQQY